MNIIIEIDPERIVERVWDAGDACGDCQYCHGWKEPHGEWLQECRVLEGKGLEHEKCPGFEAEFKLMEGQCAEAIRDVLPDGATLVLKEEKSNG